MYKFEPIRKTLVWGTESWVLSGVPGFESVVADGPEKGRRITELFPGEFPLLVKFIDAKRDLSIQVHPDDALAFKRHGCRGKSEMWYVLDAAPGAKLISGLKSALTPDEYVRLVAEDRITEVLAEHEVSAGDVFFLPAGRIHSIGGGCYLAEVQQTSDITYRIYDYNRPGLDGKPRQLHTEQAKDAIDYQVYPDYRTHYEARVDEPVELVRCPQFTVDMVDLTPAAESSRRAAGNYFSDKFAEKPISAPLSAAGDTVSFLVLIGVSGSGTVRSPQGETTLAAGEAVLLMEGDLSGFSLVPGRDGLRLLSAHI